MSLNFSIIIPTHNRAELLKTTLSTLQKLRYPLESFEVLVVVNDLHDSKTLAVLKKKQKALPNLKYLIEEQKGASFARNAAIAKAKFKHLIFIDDDVLVRPDFLAGYNAAWQRHPDAQIIGGRILAALKGNKKFTDDQLLKLKHYSWCFSQLDASGEEQRVKLGEPVFSANMSLKKTPENKFSTELGIAFLGKEQLGAEDFELVNRTILKGKPVWLVTDPAVQVRHLVSPHRFEASYLTYRHLMAGIEMYRVDHTFQEKFPDYKSVYRQSLKQPHVLLRLLTNKNDRVVFLSYFFNGKYFT